MDCRLSFDDSDRENDDAENQENSQPNISHVGDTLRKRDRGLRGMAFRFNGKVTGFTFSDSSQYDRIHEFNTKLGDRLLSTMQNQEPLKWISYVVFSYEIDHLSCSIVFRTPYPARVNFRLLESFGLCWKVWGFKI